MICSFLKPHSIMKVELSRDQDLWFCSSIQNFGFLMLLSNTDINNFVSFGVVSPDGVTDVLITYHCIP